MTITHVYNDHIMHTRPQYLYDQIPHNDSRVYCISEISGFISLHKCVCGKRRSYSKVVRLLELLYGMTERRRLLRLQQRSFLPPVLLEQQSCCSCLELDQKCTSRNLRFNSQLYFTENFAIFDYLYTLIHMRRIFWVRYKSFIRLD